MKLGRISKKIMSVVLSAAIIAANLSVAPRVSGADFPDGLTFAEMINSDYNMTLGAYYTQ